jgi:hypothetical protein
MYVQYFPLKLFGYLLFVCYNIQLLLRVPNIFFIYKMLFFPVSRVRSIWPPKFRIKIVFLREGEDVICEQAK